MKEEFCLKSVKHDDMFTPRNHVEPYVISNIKIDDEIISNRTSRTWGIWEGDITSEQLPPDIFHIVSLYHARNGCCVHGLSYVGIVLIYKQ